MVAWVLVVACTQPSADPDPESTPSPSVTLRAEPPQPPVGPSFVPRGFPRPGGHGRLLPRQTVVVGGGPAGLATAMDLEGPVILVDAASELGGRGRISGGLSLFVGTPELEALGITLAPEELVGDWERLTGSPATEATARWLAESGAVRDRLVGLGVTWTVGRADPILGKWWLHQPDGGGAAIADALEAGLPGTLDIRLDTRVTGLRFIDGQVAGVDTETGSILADTVVIATGGFVNRVDLLDLAVPDAPGTFEIGDDAFAQGDALDWAARFGLGTANLDAVGWSAGLVAAPGADGTPIRIATGTVVPWYWVDDTGGRFVDESQGWSVLLAGKERPRPAAWAVGSYERWVAGIEEPADVPLLEAARQAGDAVRCGADPATLAAAIGVDPTGLATTAAEVAEITAGTRVDVWLRCGSTFAPDLGELCAYRIGHQAMKGYGGLAVTGDGRVMDVDGVVIPGLWSVGEAAGMAVPGMGGASGWDGSMSAVVWGGLRAAAAINGGR